MNRNATKRKAKNLSPTMLTGSSPRTMHNSSMSTAKAAHCTASSSRNSHLLKRKTFSRHVPNLTSHSKSECLKSRFHAPIPMNNATRSSLMTILLVVLINSAKSRRQNTAAYAVPNARYVAPVTLGLHLYFTILMSLKFTMGIMGDIQFVLLGIVNGSVFQR